jgi:hypothetical protein
MNYQLQRIVADESSFHTLIVHRKPIEIEVLEGSPMYFKIAVKEQLSPLKFALSYKDGESDKGRKKDL